jgi:hypothetical protein
MRLSDRPTVQVEIEIAAPCAVVWQLVVDPTRMGEFSPECAGGSWDDAAATPGVGATFTATNSWGPMTWQTTSTVTQWEPERAFSFAVGDPAEPAATWRYQFHPTRGGGTRLVEQMEFGPGTSGTTARIAEVPDKEEQVVAARTAEHARNMAATLAAIKAVAEREAS